MRGVILENEQKELISDYLKLDRRIERIEWRLEKVKNEFVAQNFYGGIDYYDPIGIRSKGFNVCSRVSGYVDITTVLERNIDKNRRREYHFNRYIQSIDQRTYSSLKRRYGTFERYDDIQTLGSDNRILKEILEIEEAISHEFNEPLQDEVNREILAIQNEPLTNDTLEQSFDKITELLGV